MSLADGWSRRAGWQSETNAAHGTKQCYDSGIALLALLPRPRPDKSDVLHADDLIADQAMYR